ncbi:carboxypeptidase-like regulatory domain-containing protein [Gimesia chilikensis]|uniref:carboxypeptidase-like regulatory domain-containing protein n=1 Tax=Gimesia chilikensis TaxID=2605989 RepID=UPI003A911577|nr:carboxypeptidase-like regulatory domain-containing protein [bacterium]
MRGLINLKPKTVCTLVTLSLLAASLTGCGGGGADTPELGEVTGIITLDGNPLSGAEVVFEPASGAPSVGKTDESGSYELIYNQDASGALPGQHTVRISKFGEPGSPSDTENQIPAKFNANSKLTAEVKAGDNTVNFDLESK